MKAARELNYRLNFFARSLRVRRTYTIGVILERSATPTLDRDQRH
jgi:DNA-binding LacI/PurR family transcriptional regulator